MAKQEQEETSPWVVVFFILKLKALFYPLIFSPPFQNSFTAHPFIQNVHSKNITFFFFLLLIKVSCYFSTFFTFVTDTMRNV